MFITSFMFIFASKKQKLLTQNYLKLSIIIPVYQVEKYIRPCLESVFKQGLNDEDFELIIVNDGTKDRSMEMIADIISQHDNVTIINQENQGLSVARNNGIAAARGEYILMPDSDDLLVEGSLKPLLEKALETKADLVVADFLKMTDEGINDSPKIDQPGFQITEKTGEQLFLEDLNPYQCYVWRTLFRKEFLVENHLRFVPGIYIQDMPFTHECYLKARKCLRASRLLNIYRKRPESATSSFNKKKVKDFCIAIGKTWELTRLSGLSPQIQSKLREDIYASFSMVVWITVHKIEKAPDRKDIIHFMKQQVPDLWFNHGMKQTLESCLYKYTPYLLIRLHQII